VEVAALRQDRRISIARDRDIRVDARLRRP
jgi:hypothetical protein